MGLVNGGGTNPQQIIQMVQVGLIQYRSAMYVAEQLNGWASAVSISDLTAAPPDGPGMMQSDAQALLSAVADMWGHSQLYQTGTDPRDVPANYDYGQSQRLVIGPRLN